MQLRFYSASVFLRTTRHRFHSMCAPIRTPANVYTNTSMTDELQLGVRGTKAYHQYDLITTSAKVWGEE